jgi:hypothetical protein
MLKAIQIFILEIHQYYETILINEGRESIYIESIRPHEHTVNPLIFLPDRYKLGRIFVHNYCWKRRAQTDLREKPSENRLNESMA